MFKSNHTEYDIQTNLEFHVQFYSNHTQIANSFFTNKFELYV